MSLVENRGGGSASCDDAREDSANVSEAVRPLLDILYGAQSTTAQHSTRAWLFVSHASSLLAAASRAEEIECFCRSLRPDAALPLALVLDILSEV